MKTTKDWSIYCEKTFNNLKANAHKWNTSPEWNRAITRDFYLGVFDCGNPNPTGLISKEAHNNKMNKLKTVYDHCLSPQFIGRMIMDNQDTYFSDYWKFRTTFWNACRTVIVTQKENESLSFLTSNDQDGYKVLVSTDKKYDHLGITLFKRQKGKVHWKYVTPVETKALDVPEELLEYEKRYLVA